LAFDGLGNCDDIDECALLGQNITVSVANGKYVIDGMTAPVLHFKIGETYTFIHPSAHPFQVNAGNTIVGSHKSTTEYEVTITGNETEYICSNHLNMGNSVSFFPCAGECTNTDGGYVCTDPIKIGDSIETFVDRNRHICPHGFVLTANKPTAMNRISSPSGDFACPKLKSLGENVVYNDNHIMTQFITHNNEGALESEYCTYAYRKITKDIENFRDEV
jgi:hypothetical protein